MNSDLKSKLEILASNYSNPFCYSCYHVCPNGRCQSCGSDDLMRSTPNGCEYGLDWVIEEILNEKLTPVNTEEAFEESVRSTLENETVTIGWMSFDAVTIMKELDPVSWEIAKSDYENFEESEGNLISMDNGSTYYLTSEIEELLEHL